VTRTAQEVQEYLYSNFPLSRAMEVGVRSAGEDGVRLGAPLGANLNHQGTAFGGSISALALLSAWTVVHLGLRDEGMPCRIVIQRNSVEYLRPVDGDFEALCATPDEAEWERFVDTLRRRGRARIVVRAQLLAGNEVVGTFQGSFVAALAESCAAAEAE
jgi:thioesterase domain-containing protein